MKQKDEEPPERSHEGLERAFSVLRECFTREDERSILTKLQAELSNCKPTGDLAVKIKIKDWRRYNAFAYSWVRHAVYFLQRERVLVNGDACCDIVTYEIAPIAELFYIRLYPNEVATES